MIHDPAGHTVSCGSDGKTYRGNCWIAGKILVVPTCMCGKSTQLGSHSARTLAEQLLLKLVMEGKA